MVYLFRFVLLFIFVNMLLRSLISFISRGKRRTSNPRSRNQYSQQRRNQPKEPEKQADRIIEYKRKKFDAAEVEDAEFLEVKDYKKE